MSKYLDAIALHKQIKERISEAIEGELFVKDKVLSDEIFQQLIEENDLVSEILVEGSFSAVKYHQRLRDIDFLSERFIKLLDNNKEFDPDFQPFEHQFATLDATKDMKEDNKPALVVTAPTGAGKTEAFILPMIEDLLKKPRKSSQKGVRAIILYPMNALVADQNKRLFNYLKGQKKIQMFFYNSETPEHRRNGCDEAFDDKCFICSREEARKYPPDIMITNYSMLEYILSRPNDYPLIGDALRTIVVDEAHLYSGTLAAEVSLLLDRVLFKAGKKSSEILHIATSATISENTEEQRSFFASFFNKSEESISLIKGEKDPGTIEVKTDLIDDIQTFKNFDVLISKSSEELYKQFEYSSLYRDLRDKLLENYTLSLNNLCKTVSESLDASTMLNILTIGAKARKSEFEQPLLPHKLHLQARAAQGFSVCIDPKCPDRYSKKLGKLHHGTFYGCSTCHSTTLNVVSCTRCKEVLYAGQILEDDKVLFSKIDNRFPERTKYFSFKESNEPFSMKSDGMKCSSANAVNTMYLHTECPSCSNDVFKPLTLSDQFMLPLITETMLVGMPDIDSGISDLLPAKGRRLIAFSDSRNAAARLGPLLTNQHETQMYRYMICQSYFSNSSLNSTSIDDLMTNITLTKTQIENAPNQAMKQMLQQSLDTWQNQLMTLKSGKPVQQLILEMQDYPLLNQIFNREVMSNQTLEDQQKWFELNTKANKEDIYYRIAKEMVVPNIKATNIESVGLLALAYPGIENIKLDPSVNVEFPTISTLIEKELEPLKLAFLYVFRKQRAISVGSDEENYKVDIDGLGTYVSFGSKGKRLNDIKVGSKSYLYRFVVNVLASFNVEADEDQVHKFIKMMFDTFVNAANTGNYPWLETKEMETHEESLVTSFRINFKYLSLMAPAEMYLNKLTGHLWGFNVNGVILEECGASDLELVDKAYLDTKSRVSRMRNMYQKKSELMEFGLWAEEHSAQLSSTENRRLQSLFLEGKRNILSATTTLEVGIDIGGLSGVLMANIPPNKANYIQRSGRAGRRNDGSSIVLTYAKARHFDQNSYENFNFYLEKPLRKLTISLEKEKIASRHFNSLLLSLFYTSAFEDNNQKLFSSFKKMGNFLGLDADPRYATNVSSKKFKIEKDKQSIYQRLLEYLNDLDTDEIKSKLDVVFERTPIRDYSRYKELFIEKIIEVSAVYVDEIQNYINDWNVANVTAQRNAIRYNIKQKLNESLIEAFANDQILPKYGFPIDVKSLQVISGYTNQDARPFSFERSGILALAEYAPGSKILAGGRTVVSRGISKHFSGNNLDEAFGERGMYYFCQNGHFFKSTKQHVDECAIDSCGAKVGNPNQYLIPEHGFITAASEEITFKLKRPERVGFVEVYTDIDALEQDTKTKSIEYNDFVILYKENATVYGINKGQKQSGFAICSKCGYSESENVNKKNGLTGLSTSFKQHASIYNEYANSSCLDGDGYSVWRNQHLAVTMKTDSILIIPKQKIYDENMAQAILNAFQLSGCEELGIDEREIGTMLLKDDGAFQLYLYDNLSGGVGYVYDLAYNRWNQWLQKSIERLHVNDKHNEECINGCIKCIVTLNTNKILPRKEAYNYLIGELKTEEHKEVKPKLKTKRPVISEEDRTSRFSK